MSKTKFTPGPWNTVGHTIPCDGLRWLHANNGIIVVSSGPIIGDRGELLGTQIVINNPADTHLIEAAPGLYGACELAASKHPAGTPTRKVLDAALAKARGE